MRPRSASGQAAVEYLALVGLVAGVLLFAGFVLGGRAIASATLAQVRRGLCIVEGHDCAVARPACLVASRRTTDDLHLDVAVVRLAGGTSALVERLSDGRMRVTVGDHLDGGLSFAVGANAGVGRVVLGGELRASAMARRGAGTTYEVGNEREAAALLRLLHRPKVDPAFYTPAVSAYWRRVEAVLPRIPPPVARYSEAGGTASLVGSLGLGPAAVRAVAGGELFAGERQDLRTGRRTLYLRGSTSLDAGAGVRGVGATGSASARVQVALTVDREGRPLDLALLGVGALRASPDLPALLQPVAGHLRAGRGRSWELEAHLDLTQPGRAASLRGLVEAVAGGDASQVPAVLSTIMAEGAAQVRTYGSALDRLKLEGRLQAGLGIGAGALHTSESARLLAALERGSDGFWIPRYDCLSAV
jgi:hypothetical protein